MPRFDLPTEQLRTYRPEVAEPADFDAFWAATLAEHRPPVAPVVTRVSSSLTLVDVFDVTFGGFDGHPIKAWLLLPKGADGPLPGIVEYVGYGGGRGLAHERLNWVASGYAHLVMDTRGQGSAWGTGGDTPDPVGSGAAHPGFMTRGIDRPETYYYRRVFTDAVQAVEVLRSLPQVDPARVSVLGGSQGGGIAIAVAGLMDGLLAALPDVPFLCNFERAVGLNERYPYQEIAEYLAVHRGAEPRVFGTLAYFDGVSFARRTTAPALFSVGLIDPICPPSTVYAAYNQWAGGPNQIEEYPFNEHEGGAGFHWLRQAEWLASRVATG